MAQAHYHGDRMRSLVLAIAIIMVVSMPFFFDLIPKPQFLSVLVALILVILGGWVSPKHKAVVTATTAATSVAFVIFQYYALQTFQAHGVTDPFFLTNELLAILSLLATYFGTKSIRGIILAEGL